MRRIIHLSDLHFGAIDLPTLEPLILAVHAAAPHLIAISGDLTQRARRTQFKEAAEFLKRLPSPRIVVPGNHDIPLYKLFSRFFHPLSNYRRFISEERFPFYGDSEIAVIGISTARSLTTKYGRINEAQVAHIREKIEGLKGVVKIVVTHHPFDLPENISDKNLVGRAEMAMKNLAESKIDIFLAGHLHLTRYGGMVERYKANGYSSLFVQAGTATSSRGRGEANSFNILDIEPARLRIQKMAWDSGENQFKKILESKFSQSPAGWREESFEENKNLNDGERQD